MNRVERKDFVLKCLLENDPNSHLHYQKIHNHLNSHDLDLIYTAPINPKYLQVDQTPIIMTKNVIDALNTIDDYNLKQKKEVPFIIYGKVTKGGAIFLDDLYCHFDKLKKSSSNIEKLEDFLFARLQAFVEDNKKEQVIVLGHTHPFNGKVSFNYSISDLMFHIFYYQYNVFSNPKYSNILLSLAKTITQDYNFIFFDPKTCTFKSFNKVYMQTKKKEYIPLSALKYCDD